METVEQKVRDILKLKFTDEEIEFEHFYHEPEEQVYGRIISEKFEGLDHEARHEMIWNLLCTHLTPEERQHVLSFLTYTPAEVKFYTEAYEGPPPEKLPLEVMETIEHKVKDTLKLQFTDEEIRFDHEPGERISGFIVSEKFFDMDEEARQDLIWNLLSEHLTPKERRQVLGFFPFTPAEFEFYTEAREEVDY